MANAVTKAAPLTIHLAIAFPFAPTRGKGLKIACAELEVLNVRSSRPLSSALVDMLSARWMDELEPVLSPRPRPARPGLAALLSALLDRSSASKSGAGRLNARVSFTPDAASMETSSEASGGDSFGCRGEHVIPIVRRTVIHEPKG